MTAPRNWAGDLAAALNVHVFINNGDARVILDGGDFIYCGITGKVRAQIGGHVITLGSTTTPTRELAAAFHDATGAVAS